ncbi:hypothetical protein QQ045_026769 [Rhodiola kirilowii]
MLENEESFAMGGGGGGNVSEGKAHQKENGGEGVAKFDAEDEEEEDRDVRVFSVGEFVWGKIKNHPWWPGQIYDISDASDLALKHKTKDKDSYLVAYFGDGTFSWCSSSQLMIFHENFESFSCQSSSKSFIFGVEDALSVIREVVALEMKCSCVQVGHARPVAENAGIIKGVSVPMVGVDGSVFTRFDAAAIVDSVKNAAQSVSAKNKLELTILSSKLLAFYRTKGYSELPKYYFPVYIDGLEDISKSGIRADLPVDCLVSDELKLYGRRKQTSLTDTIKKEIDTDVHYDEEFKVNPPSRQGTRRRKRVGGIYSSEKDRSKGRTRVATTSAEKDGAIKSRDKKRNKDSFTPVASIKQVGFEPVLLNLHKYDGVGERMSEPAPPIRKQCNIIFEKEPVQGCSFKDIEPLLQSDENTKPGQGGSVIDLMPKEMLSGIRPAVAFSPLRERPFGSRLDVFSLNKVSNNDTLMDADNDDDNGRPLSAILFLTFSPGMSLPSKADLHAKFREFGSLNEEEANVLPNSLSAQVVFIKKSEGEQAFEHMVKMNSPDSGVNYRIRYIQRGSKFEKQNVSKTSPQLSNVDDNPQPLSIDYVKQKLETLISKLRNVEGDTLSNNLKYELHIEMTNLLEKLS